MPEWLFNLWNVFLMILGFGLVIVVHELGHFLAARWAGVRVHAFAVGFGPAIGSWRKGLGFRAGSSEAEYLRLLRREGDGPPPPGAPVLSPTEYRLNWFPFGGYVKMLGQEDANPGAVSHAPDSYMMKSVPKRMVIISAGVIMNVILAAVLFVVVFLAGMKELAPIVGDVAPGSPAAAAGLRRGDLVTSINADRTSTFTDIGIATAMSRRGESLAIEVRRPVGEGGEEALSLRAVPTVGRGTGLLQIGIAPASSATLADAGKTAADREIIRAVFERAGLGGVEPGSTLVAVNGAPLAPTTVDPFGRDEGRQSVTLLRPLEEALERAEGGPVSATFRSPAGAETAVSLRAKPKFERAAAAFEGVEGALSFEHLLGFTPLMTVEEAQVNAKKQGLQTGDIFARLGDAEWPDLASGIAAIRSRKGREIDVRLIRDGVFIELKAKVDAQGRIGFVPGTTADRAALVTRFPSEAVARAAAAAGREGEASTEAPASERHDENTEAGLAALRLDPPILAPMRIERVAGRAVGSFAELRAALVEAARPARGAAAAPEPLRVELELALLDPATMQPRGVERAALALTPRDIERLSGLGWSSAELAACFQPATILLKTRNPLHALILGVQRTHHAMLNTYLTFARLFEGTVKVEHLKGPVGITHAGSLFAAQGFIYLLFFLALISANLAVINFLPLPIVDGGLFIFLVVEALTRRPVSIRVQNIATIAGLMLIGAVFIIVTYNDIRNLFG